ncbi:MAG: hypothetical protein KA099_10890 [Alphaproteobacteria bacterium]|nr:hypothetical protein [Alphaproteobacteria bacterium]MBP7757765.1 hypothetical protein [Alphaproteobacteria bacterium]MBP7761035.1 hypothetical protein [Alphaproteobacteria bacterium]MBP7905822.1 hypothetical protein [Alphaproteobacteria bacterium]
MDKAPNDTKLTKEEADGLAEQLREFAQMRDLLDESQEKYRELDRKYPLKTKSKYAD